MQWRIGVGAVLAAVGALLFANYVRLLPDQPPFAPTTAILWALGLVTLAGLGLAGWGGGRTRSRRSSCCPREQTVRALGRRAGIGPSGPAPPRRSPGPGQARGGPTQLSPRNRWGPVDLDEGDTKRVVAIVALVAIGFAAIWFTRAGTRFGLSPLAAGIAGLVVGAIVWTGILWIVISRGQGAE